MSTDRDEITARLTAPGAPFEIRTEDVRGVPLPVFARRQQTLGQVLRASEHFGEREYLVTENASMSFTEHLAHVGALAAALRDRFGIGKGDRVAICSANNPEWIVIFWATVALGAVAVGLNSLWAPPELEHGMSLTEPTVIFADAPRRALVGEPGIPVVSIEDELPALLREYAGAPLPQDVNG
ncbi:MAG: AMP-binding protein [Jatrophihabitans sp.]